MEREIIFRFKKKAEKEKENHLQAIRKIRIDAFKTRISATRDSVALHYRIKENRKDIDIELITYREFKEEFKGLLKEIEIISDSRFHSSSYNEISERLEVTEVEFNSFLAIFLKPLENPNLESNLSTCILSFENFCIPEEYLRFTNRFQIFKKLFNSPHLTNEEVKLIFLLIDGSDTILMKLIFFLISRKGTFNLEELSDLFRKVRGTEPFNMDLLDKCFFSEEISRLEIYFKNIELMYNSFKDLEHEQVITHPLNPGKLKRMERFSEALLQEFFRSYIVNPIQVIQTFERVIRLEYKRKYNKELNSIFSFSWEKDDLESFKKDKLYYQEIEDLLFDLDQEIESNTNEFVKRIKKLKDSLKIYNESLRKYIIFEGFYHKNEARPFSEFIVSDINDKRIKCRIEKNKAYFRKLDLKMESKIQVQGILNLDYQINIENKKFTTKDIYLEVIDLSILDNFRAIECPLSTGSYPTSILHNTREGLSLYVQFKNGKTRKHKILKKPLQVLNIFKNNMGKEIFEIQIGDNIFAKPEREIPDYIIEEEKSLARREGLRDYIRNIIYEYTEKYKDDFPILDLYNTVGVFLDSNKELTIARPDDPKIKLYGENSSQEELIKDIQSKNLDVNGDLTEDFFEIIHLNILPQHFRFGVYSFSAISPFFFAMNDILDLIPHFFAVGAHGAGKSKTAEIFIDRIIGTTKLIGQNIRTESRFTHELTLSTFARHIEDLNGLDEKQKEIFKTMGTGRPKREVMQRDSKTKDAEQMYPSIISSANSNKFYSSMSEDDEAFRVRCWIFEDLKKIDYTKHFNEIKKFRMHENKIIAGRLFGFYLLDKAVEYFDKTIEGEYSKYEKLRKLFDITKTKFENFLVEKNLKVSDPRRPTLYTLFNIGLQIWKYINELKGFKSEIIDEYLDFYSENFLSLFEEQEYKETEKALEKLITIFYYFKNNKQRVWLYKFQEIPALTTRFIDGYNQWARQRNYPTYDGLTDIAKMQSNVLQKDIKAKSRYIESLNDGDQDTIRCVPFYFEELQELIEPKKEKELDCKDLNLGKELNHRDMDRIFKGESKEKIEKIEYILNRLKEIFEENNFKELELTNVLQALELEDNLTSQFIKDVINDLIGDGTLIKKGGIITLKNRNLTL